MDLLVALRYLCEDFLSLALNLAQFCEAGLAKGII